jgi:nucleoside-diphosphate-sugar epimerase
MHDRIATVIRAGPVVGAPAAPDAPFKSDRRFEDLRRCALDGRSLVVARHDGRQFVAAADLARVYVAALEREHGGETFLAVARDFVTWESVARTIVRATGRGEVVVEDTGLAPEPHRFDTDRIERSLGLRLTCAPAVDEHVAHLVRSAR